jgi:hypothetical protein
MSECEVAGGLIGALLVSFMTQEVTVQDEEDNGKPHSKKFPLGKGTPAEDIDSGR